MKTRYVDLIEQTFDFPKDEFKIDDDQLLWNDLPLVELLEKHGTPCASATYPRSARRSTWPATASPRR
jgi:arginine decarboxylase